MIDPNTSPVGAADYEESCHRLAAELRNAKAEIERLRAQLHNLPSLLVEITELRARNVELVAALAPFAKAAVNYVGSPLRNDFRAVRLVDCEAARAALAKVEHDPRDDFSPQNDPFAKAEGQ